MGEPINENALHGSHMAFTELLETNIAVIQQRIKSEKLHIKYFTVGETAKTEVAVVYMSDRVKQNVLVRVEHRIANLKVDYMFNKKVVIDTLTDKGGGAHFFTTRVTERYDSFASELMQGKVGVIVDNNPFGVTMPTTFWEGFFGSDDYFSDDFRGYRLWRVLGFMLASFLPGLFIAFACHHYDYALKIMPKTFEHKSALPYIIQVAVSLIIYHNLSDIVQRINRYLIFFIALLAANTIGPIATEAKLIDPIVVFVMALSTVASLQNKARFAQLQWTLCWTTIFGGYLFGFKGVAIPAAIAFIWALCLRSFGEAYLKPGELLDNIFLRGDLRKLINKRKP